MPDETKLVGVQGAIKDTERMLARLEGEELRQALLPAARVFHDRAQDLAPYDETREKGTHLRDALFIDTRAHESKQTDVLVGVNHRKAPHAHLMEMGWEKKPEGVPFLRPAAAQVQGEIQRRVGDAIKAQVEKP